MEAQTEQTTAPTPTSILKDLGVTFSFKEIRRRSLENKIDKQWPAAHFEVTLVIKGRTWVTEYSMGGGHFKRCRTLAGEIKPTKDVRAERIDHPIVAAGEGPTLADVFYSLMSDGDSGNETFEDFCLNCGYDTDSRTAEAMWRECVNTSIKLRGSFSANELETLREAFQDY